MSPAPPTQTPVCTTQPPPPTPAKPHLGLKLSATNSHFINQDDLSSCEFIFFSLSGIIVQLLFQHEDSFHGHKTSLSTMFRFDMWSSSWTPAGLHHVRPRLLRYIFSSSGSSDSSKNKNTNWRVFISVWEKYSKCF